MCSSDLLGVMGGENLIGLSKANRALLGVEIGDEVSAVITVDDTPREVEIPPALAEALAGDEAARTAYEKLPFTHRKEYAEWVGSAVCEAICVGRVTKALEMLGASTVDAPPPAGADAWAMLLQQLAATPPTDEDDD